MGSERRTSGPAGVFWVFAAAALCSALVWLWPLWFQASPERLTSQLRASFGAAWEDLGRQADEAVATLPSPRETPREDLFIDLGEAVAQGDQGADLLLLDATGEAIAWAGQGLLHEPAMRPQPGFSYRSGLTAVTLFATRWLEDGDRRYALVAGRSLAHSSWPFGGIELDDQVDWWLGAAGNFDQGAASLAGAGELLEIAWPEAPSLYVLADTLRPRPTWVARLLPSLAWLLWSLALILVRQPLSAATDDRQPGGRWKLASAPMLAPLWTSLAIGLAVLGIGQAMSLQAGVIGSLALASGLAAWGVDQGLVASAMTSATAVGGGSAWRRGGVAGVLILLAGGLFRQALLAVSDTSAGSLGSDGALPDLAVQLLGDGDTVGLRLAWGLFAFAVLCILGRRRAPAVDGRGVWGTILLLLAAAAVTDHLWWSRGLLLVGVAVAVRWLAGESERRRLAVVGPLLLISALASAGVWESGHRESLRQALASRYLELLAPPTQEESNDLLIELDRHFASLPASVTRPAGPGGDLQDLAYILWRQSPMADRDGLSALVVEPTLGKPSSFSFGLALDADLEVILDPASWRVPPVAAWQRSMLWGETVLGSETSLDGGTLDGEIPPEGEETPWGTVRYAYLPRPGFRLGVSEVDELAAYLVQGENHREVIDGLPRSVLFGLYGASGRSLVSPWREAPPLPASVLEGEQRHGQVETLSGRSWYWRRDGDEGIRVLFLPVLGPLQGLERVGTHALGCLFSLTSLGLLILLLVWPWARTRQWIERTLSSYARRLILVYTVLLLVPLIALNLVLVRSFERRLVDEQRSDAREAISSARVFLIDYLQGLDPGFGIDTQINRTLMEWISQILQHQVNLYWGSQVYTSSQQELFTAGLLPQRIPGEIFSRLAYRGYEIGERRQKRPEDIGYLELYAPLEVPGLSLSEQGLFLSVPLLEQDKEVDRELATFRRRALLVTSGLFLLLVAVGSRLAQSFTKPIMTLIQGTQRIARGATSLPWRPREEELSSLAAAIDDMAGRLAEGRRRLVREKHLVDRIIENITSGVVSVDRQRRVLLHNRVAADLLSTEVGEDLLASVAQAPRLAAVAERLRQEGTSEWRSTLRIRSRDDEARDWNLMWLPLPGEDPAALLVVDDVTEVLRGQRLEAWAEMARIIAHEIKNPLTPIRLSTEHMQQVYRRDREHFEPVFVRCTDNILRQVEELRDIATDFSIYSRIPKAELVDDELGSTVDDLLQGYRETPRTLGVEIVASVEPRPLYLRCDRKLLGRALRNLLENALRANGGRGQIELMVRGDAEGVTIRVADQGPGVDSSHVERIFEPYFSTHESGTGLGLAITRRIVEEHGGHIEARNRTAGGLEVIMFLPTKGQPQNDTAEGGEQ